MSYEVKLKESEKQNNIVHEEKEIDPAFRILSCMAIIFVVAGHIDFGVFDVAGMFPYYSFHVGIFAFVSGYFYKEENEKNIKKYLIKRLVIFYCLILYGILFTELYPQFF